jgi:site-specific DNA recombinase
MGVIFLESPLKVKCAIYARVSTDKQGDSIDNQVCQCEEYISRLGEKYDTSDIIVYRDQAVSGYYTSVFDRAEMKQAIKDAREHKFKLLVFKEVSRVGRDKQENPAIIGMFEQYGVRVVAINDNYDSLNKDNITFDILSVLSEQESKKISARVSSARKQKARRGQWGGEPPIGYKVDPNTKKLVADTDRKDIPITIFDLYVNKGLGTFKVAEHLNLQGVRTKDGNLWSRGTVNKVIRNQAYIGSVVYGTRRNQLQREYDDTGKMTKKKVQIKINKEDWQVAENAHEALVDRDIFFRAQRILLSKSHDRAPRRPYHPLSGILFCGKCNEGMVCQKRSFNGKQYRYYICKTYHKYGRHKCNQANVNADELEEAVVSQVRKNLEMIPEELFSITINREKDKERIKDDLRLKTAKREKIKKDQVDIFQQRELFDEDTYRREMLNIKQRIRTVNDEIEILEKQMKYLDQQGANSSNFSYFLEEFRQLDLNNAGLRQVLHELIKNIRLLENHIVIDYHYNFELGMK